MEKPRTPSRRHDIDWLRVILFGLLICFHYVVTIAPPENQELYESNLLLAFTVDVVHQWRLAALFVISGMGTAFAFRRRTWQAYLKERGIRLLVPLLFTAYILYLGLFTPVDTTRHLLSIFPGVEAMPYVHLWFVYNLLIYSVALTPLFVHVRRNPNGKLVRSISALLNMRNGLGIMLIPPLMLATIGILFKPWMPGEAGTWWEFPWYLLYFAFGYLLLAAQEAYFAVLDRIRIPVTIITPFLAILYFLGKRVSQVPGLMEGGWVQQGIPAFSFAATLGTLIQAFHAWFWCLLIFSWGSRVLNRPSRALTYLNQAVYPTYIVHIHVLGLAIALIYTWAIPAYIGLILGPVLITLGCLLVFEIVKRARLARVAFGIKSLPTRNGNEHGKGSRLAISILFHLLSIIVVIVLVWGMASAWNF